MVEAADDLHDRVGQGRRGRRTERVAEHERDVVLGLGNAGELSRGGLVEEIVLRLELTHLLARQGHSLRLRAHWPPVDGAPPASFDARGMKIATEGELSRRALAAVTASP